MTIERLVVGWIIALVVIPISTGFAQESDTISVLAAAIDSEKGHWPAGRTLVIDSEAGTGVERVLAEQLNARSGSIRASSVCEGEPPLCRPQG